MEKLNPINHMFFYQVTFRGTEYPSIQVTPCTFIKVDSLKKGCQGVYDKRDRQFAELETGDRIRLGQCSENSREGIATTEMEAWERVQIILEEQTTKISSRVQYVRKKKKALKEECGISDE